MDFFQEGKLRKFLTELPDMSCTGYEPVSLLWIADVTDTVHTETFLDTVQGLDFRPFANGEIWGRQFGHYCFRIELEIPSSYEGTSAALKIETGREGSYTAFTPQFLAYVDGRLAHGLDIYHNELEISPCAKGGTRHTVLLHSYAGTTQTHLYFKAGLVAIDYRIRGFYYDLKAAFDAQQLLPDDDARKPRLLQVLLRAYRALDLRSLYSEAFYSSLKIARQILESEVYQADWGSFGAVAHGIGHTHIDIAWMWDLDQTKEKVQRSFSTALSLMDKYPDYMFMSSQPILYKFLKDCNPALFERVRQKVREGVWEAEGGMYIEPDCNLPGGESLIRQILFGKAFFKEHFGVENEILWLPDSFGYTGALPQIMKLSGLKYFLSSKLSWNEMNPFPYDTFLWTGIDGSSVTAYFITTPDDEGLAFAPDFSTYNATLQPKNVLGAWRRYKQKNVCGDILVTFGYGDGGGGPTAEMLELGRRMACGLPGIPQYTTHKAIDFFHSLDKKTDVLPRWKGELYFEYHRGTYTSMAKNKRNNRKCEWLLHDWEWLASMAMVCLNTDYPGQELHDTWETVLTGQFHDVLTGTAIEPVFEQTDISYAQVKKTGEEHIGRNMRTLAEQICLSEESVVVYNAQPFTGGGIVEISGIPAFYAADIPAYGYRAFPLPALKTGENGPDWHVSTTRLSNAFFDISLDDSGRIVSLFDRSARREVIKPGCAANALQAFEDRPMANDAWNIDCYYEDKRWDITQADDIAVLCGGPLKGVVRIKRRFQSSVIEQDMIIYRDNPVIDFVTRIDWQESQILLKAAFPVAIHADYATYDIQFGNIKRPTTRNTTWEQAMFEVCGHKWADLSEDDYGVSILNDCKYGYDIRGDVMRITLLKSPVDPNPHADLGTHKFIYSLYPHKGRFTSGGTVPAAYRLNNPIRAVRATANPAGRLPETFSFVTSSTENVVVECAKKAERENAVVIRAYESYNRRGPAALTFGRKPRQIKACDLMENELPGMTDELRTKGATVEFEVKPYEIKTFIVVF